MLLSLQIIEYFELEEILHFLSILLFLNFLEI
jgi:hypothetical protein